MTIGTLFTFIFIIGVPVSFYYEHKANYFEVMFDRDPNVWSILNLFGAFIWIGLVISQLVIYWNVEII
jgi:hypothetical protein